MEIAVEVVVKTDVCVIVDVEVAVEIEETVVVRTRGLRLQKAKAMTSGGEPLLGKAVYQTSSAELVSSSEGVSITRSRLEVWFEFNRSGFGLAVQRMPSGEVALKTKAALV